MRDREIVIRLQVPRSPRARWTVAGIAGALLVGAVAVAGVPMFTDGTTLKAADLNAVAAATVPSGAVMFFNLTACPPEWTALTSAQGRYLVGLPAGGTLGGTDGTPLGDREDRPVGQHTHSIADPGHTHTYFDAVDIQKPGNMQSVTPASPYGGNPVPTSASTTGIVINNAGSVAGTNAPYLELLVCQKK